MCVWQGILMLVLQILSKKKKKERTHGHRQQCNDYWRVEEGMEGISRDGKIILEKILILRAVMEFCVNVHLIVRFTLNEKMCVLSAL